MPDFKTDYKAMVIEKVRYWHKYRQIEKWNSIESRNRPKIIKPNNFQQNNKKIQWEKVFSTNGTVTILYVCGGKKRTLVSTSHQTQQLISNGNRCKS